MPFLTSGYEGFCISSASPEFVISYFAGFFFVITILARVRWYPIAVLLSALFYIIEYLYFFFWEMSSQVFGHVLIKLVIFLLHFLSRLHRPGYQFFVGWMAVKYSSYSVGCLYVSDNSRIK